MKAKNVIKMKKIIRYSGILVLAAALVTGGWFFYPYVEGEVPEIVLSPDFQVLGQEKTFSVSFGDRKSGLKSTAVVLSQGDRRHVLQREDFPRKGVAARTLTLKVRAGDLNLKNGEALLEISAQDHSLRKNRGTLTRTLRVDVIPPHIQILTDRHYLNPGGAGLVVYRVSKERVKTAVMVNDTAYDPYETTVSGLPAYLAYVAVPRDAGKGDLTITVKAEDEAGNLAQRAVDCHVRNRSFRKDDMVITTRFLEKKMPEFRAFDENLGNLDLLGVFCHVNTIMREENFKTIAAMCRSSEPHRLWEGPFLRMKNAANMARFGDHRTYVFEGRPIGESIHNGIDLASTAHAPVEAANHGKVVFSGFIGIYGNAILIDHGQGIFSFYSHLGMMDVQVGQSVRKGEMIGRTDTTGLAGGDHLHFGVFAGRDFVNPQEWWDPHWIRDNITAKLGES